MTRIAAYSNIKTATVDPTIDWSTSIILRGFIKFYIQENELIVETLP
jgi:hypothetical protein